MGVCYSVIVGADSVEGESIPCFFLLGCLIQHAKRKDKLYIIAIDFGGAFDRISRSHLIRKLILFDAGIICLHFYVN